MLRRSSHRLVASSLAVAILVLGQASLALATNNLNAKWKDVVVAPYQNYIRYWYHSSVPQNFRPLIASGRAVWGAVGRELVFNPGTSTDKLITITYEDLAFPNGDANAISMTYAGACFPNICTGSIAFNSTPGIAHWYTGTGTPNANNNEIDLWSVAAHEFGHQVSLTHSSAAADTMFQNTLYGSIIQRDLTTHDIQGISALYLPK